MMNVHLNRNDRLDHRIALTIGRVADLSITALLNFIRIAFLLSPFLLSLPQIAKAATNDIVTETIEYDDADQVVPDEMPLATQPASTAARFGPFAVISPTIVELNGVTDATTPGAFRHMLALYPDIKLIRMVECPGTENDDANLEVARMIRRAGLSTHVPANGSVRSGGVELFLAGVHRTHDAGAEFGVHSWLDEDGHQARDVPADDPVNLAYIHYYQDVGLAPQTAREFYAFTNQTGFDAIHYMTEPELARFHITN